MSARRARIIEPRFKAVRFPYEAECAVLLREFEVVESQWWPGTDCAGMDAGANAEGGPEGVSARKARIIEPRFKAVRFPYVAGYTDRSEKFSALYKQWWPGTESNRRHGDFQSPALPTELPGPCACVPGR